MNPYLSNTMPELTEHEANCLGPYTVSFYDEKVKHDVACKGSWYLFFFHAGITGEEEQKFAKDLAYNVGHLTVLNTKTGRTASIYTTFD